MGGLRVKDNVTSADADAFREASELLLENHGERGAFPSRLGEHRVRPRKRL